MTLATVAHFLLIIAAFSLAAFSMRWFENNIIAYVIAVACNAVGFAIIWIVMYFRWKRTVAEMNDDLKKYQESATDSSEQKK